MNMKSCLNWKVIGGLAVVGAGIWIVQPALISRALPLLLIAACPLSMIFMMGGMGKMMGGNKQGGGTGAYTCPMHRDVQGDQPGQCSKCGMSLVPTAAPNRQAQATPIGGTSIAPAQGEHVAQLRSQLQDLAAQQQVLAQRLEELDASKGPAAPSKVLRDAEAAAGAADADNRHP